MTAITRTYRTRIAAPVHELDAWHRRPGAFERLTPNWAGAEILESQGTVLPGDWKLLKIRALGPAGVQWKLVHQPGEGEYGFVDVQEHGPFASWRHVHRFLPDGELASILEDEVTYELPLGSAGSWLMEHRINDTIDRLFAFRHDRTRMDLERHFSVTLARPSRIAIAGASGLVGQRLACFLRSGGHHVERLVRRPPQAADEIFWNPANGEIDSAALEGSDAVINLAGVSIAGGRWSRKRKAAIRNSRIDGTRLLADTLANLSAKPEVFVSTSAVGYYGNGGSETLTEESPQGAGFLADVCAQWEAAAKPAADAGIRVVHPRFGVVLGAEGGMLAILARIFSLGAGGPLGNGQQFMSWIALDDLLGVLLECVSNPALSGPVNATSPQPVTNREFSSSLASVLHRPAVMRTPAFAMRLAAGQMAKEVILTSQRAVPEKLLQERFSFALPSLEQTLRHEFGRYDMPAAALPAGTMTSKARAS